MKIIGRSKAIYGTWFFLPTYKILFDCGDGAGSSLGIHTADAEHIFISHTHLDHISGIPTVLRFQQRVLKNEPTRQLATVYYHKFHHSKIQAVREFVKGFGLKFKAKEINFGEDVQVGRNVYVRSFPVDHQAAYYRGKYVAAGFHIIEKRKRLPEKYFKEKEKLEKEFGTKSGGLKFKDLMIRLKKEGGDAAISEPYEVKLLSYCGDSRPVSVEEIAGTQILMHEASFMTQDEIEAAHSAVPAVLDLAKEAKVGALVMYHISERYKRERPKYKQEITAIAKKKKFTIPLYIVGVDEFFYKDI